MPNSPLSRDDVKITYARESDYAQQPAQTNSRRTDRSCPNQVTEQVSDCRDGLARRVTYDSEPRRKQVDHVVESFDDEQDLPPEAVPRGQDLAHMRDGVRRREERTVEPPAALADELRQRFGDIGLCDRALGVLEYPVGVALRDELEAEDTLRPTSADASMSSRIVLHPRRDLEEC